MLDALRKRDEIYFENREKGSVLSFHFKENLFITLKSKKTKL